MFEHVSTWCASMKRARLGGGCLLISSTALSMTVFLTVYSEPAPPPLVLHHRHDLPLFAATYSDSFAFPLYSDIVLQYIKLVSNENAPFRRRVLFGTDRLSEKYNSGHHGSDHGSNHG